MVAEGDVSAPLLPPSDQGHKGRFAPSLPKQSFTCQGTSGRPHQTQADQRSIRYPAWSKCRNFGELAAWSNQTHAKTLGKSKTASELCILRTKLKPILTVGGLTSPATIWQLFLAFFEKPKCTSFVRSDRKTALRGSLHCAVHCIARFTALRGSLHCAVHCIEIGRAHV